MKTDTKQTTDLIDLIVKMALDAASPEVKKLVTHKWPDDDAWLCIFIGKKFVPKMANASLVFVNAGETLLGSENDPSVVHFDTGKGRNDQHGRKLRRSCSAALVAKELGVIDNPGLKPLLEMATAVDNIEVIAPDSLHFLIKGWPRKFNKNGGIDWEKVQERVFEAFEIIYDQANQNALNKLNLGRFAEHTTLRNGLKITSVLWHPELRDPAFEEGADVVIWTKRKGSRGFYTGIPVNRDTPLYLDKVLLALNETEARVRGVSTLNKDVWFLHDFKKLILNGSRTHELAEDEFTRLFPRQIVGIVHGTLSRIPSGLVSQWKKR
ncbi:hypothetical protein ES703_25496 [subsurface metagenome]